MRNYWFRHSYLRRVSYTALFIFFFIYGLGAGHYKWPPFYLLSEAKKSIANFLPKKPTEYQGEKELMQTAFTQATVPGELKYPAITKLSGIQEANQRIFMRTENFETAYVNLNVLNAEQLYINDNKTPIIQVKFSYQGRQHEAHAYGSLPKTCQDRDTASLIIPGSGINQSEGIALGDPMNYHYGILDSLDRGGGAVYIFIKPNEDFLAWHNGAGLKLAGESIWNWHLNRGGSYSVSYLVQSLAFTKWIKSCFGRTLVVGLSQGGTAAMLNSLQSEPTLVIVASGITLLNEQAELSGADQLVGVPNYAVLAARQSLIDALSNSPSAWFFSWGKAETGSYKIEAEENITAKAIEFLPNVKVVSHNRGHVFPVLEIAAFIKIQNN